MESFGDFEVDSLMIMDDFLTQPNVPFLYSLTFSRGIEIGNWAKMC